jgi:hypothetical protein
LSEEARAVAESIAAGTLAVRVDDASMSITPRPLAIRVDIETVIGAKDIGFLIEEIWKDTVEPPALAEANASMTVRVLLTELNEQVREVDRPYRLD